MRNRLAVLTCLLGIALAAPEAGAQEVSWAMRMGGASDEEGGRVAIDGHGNAYVTGWFEGTANFGSYTLTSAGSLDIFVAKLDSSGTVQWAERMGGALSDGLHSYTGGCGIAVDGGGNAFVAGRFQGTATFGSYSLTSSGDYDIFVAKLDSDGTVQWAKRMGGATVDRGYSVAVDEGGNAYVTGTFSGTADFGSYSLTSAGGVDMFVAKLDSSGTVQWAKCMGGASSPTHGRGIALDGDGNAYVTGIFKYTADFGSYSLTAASEGYFDIFVAKLDNDGTVQWARRMGGFYSDYGYSIAVDGDGNAYVTGEFSGTADFGSYSLSTPGIPNRSEIFVTKLDSSGTVQWAIRMGSHTYDSALGIAVDGDGNAYVTGWFASTAEFGSVSLTALQGWDSSDIFVASLDSSGTVQWARRMGGTSNDRGYGITVDENGNVYVTGDFHDTADFGAHNLTSAGDSDVFVQKLVRCGEFADQSTYGRLLFPPLCTRDASNLTQDVYDSTTMGLYSGDNDAFYLSSDGMNFAPLVVADAVYCDDQTVGLGPYEYQPGVPPFILGVPIENNLVPLPPHKIPTELIVEGGSELLFELLDTQREINGNTAVYLVRDCGIYLEKGENTTLHWISHDVEIEGFTGNLNVVSGALSELLEDQDFSRSCLLRTFADPRQIIDRRPDPSVGQGYYYLVSGSCANPIGYGDSSLDPDPRQTLPPGSPCP